MVKNILRRRFDHVAINVKDLEKSLFFYKDLLGLKERGRVKVPLITPWRGKMICIFLSGEDNKNEIEIIYDYDRDKDKEYVVGEKIEHICFIFDNLEKK